MTRSPTLTTLYNTLFCRIPSLAAHKSSEIPSNSLGASPNRSQRIWLLLSLGFALFYSLLALQQAFRGDYVVQDDARQHVFWMQRFIDSTAFSDDLIADYFESVAPAGYSFVYHLVARFGISPLLFHKILPVGLNLLTAGLCFRASMGLFPFPAAAFCSSIVLAQGLSLTDAIVSGTPKAFIYPLLLLFIDGVIRRQQWVAWGAIALQGFFYPQLVLISSGVMCLQLVEWKQGRLRIVADERDRIFSIGGLIVAFLVLFPYAAQSSIYGPTLTLEEARRLPELAMKGSRSRFFYDGEPSAYWLRGRSGLRLATIFTPVTNVLGLGLLLLPWLSKTLLQYLNPRVSLLPQLVLSSLGCFFVAHLLLFRLHLPSRYTQHSIRVVASLAASIVVVTLLHQIWQWGMGNGGSGHQGSINRKNGRWKSKLLAIPLFITLSGAVVFYPAWVAQFPLQTYQYGTYPELYEFLQAQPPFIRIASLTDEVNNIPTFTHRSILSGSEYAIPYHLGYYRQMRDRTTDLIQAQYSLTKQELKAFTETYLVTFWLVDVGAFHPDYIENSRWIQQHPQAANHALSQLQQPKRPRLARVLQRCQVLKERDLVLIDASCTIR